MQGDFLFSNDLYQHPLTSPSIEFTVENLLPRAEIEFATCHCDDHLSAHDLTFHMCICIVFNRIVVAVLADGFVRYEFLQPFFVIVVKPNFIIVDKKIEAVTCIAETRVRPSLIPLS